MGDWSAFRALDDLACAAEPLVSGLDTRFPARARTKRPRPISERRSSLTRFGRAVLTGEADMVAVNGIDRWWAGTQFNGHACWRWDA